MTISNAALQPVIADIEVLPQYFYGAKVSGCTVHFVDNQYDHGPVILQQTVDVHDDDTTDTLAKRIFQAECEVYAKAIGLYAQGKLRVEGRRVLGGVDQKKVD